MRRRKNGKKNEIRFKVNKLLLYVILNLFHIFFSFILRLNNLKFYKFLLNFSYI